MLMLAIYLKAHRKYQSTRTRRVIFTYQLYLHTSNHQDGEPLYQNSRVIVCSSSSSDETESIWKPPAYHVEREKRKDREPRSAAQKMVEYQYETGYTTEDTGNKLDHKDYLYRWATALLPVVLLKYPDNLGCLYSSLKQKPEPTTCSTEKGRSYLKIKNNNKSC